MYVGCSFKRQKKVLQLLMRIKKMVECYCKPNKTWVGEGSEFYNKSITAWLEDNRIEIYFSDN